MMGWKYWQKMICLSTMMMFMSCIESSDISERRQSFQVVFISNQTYDVTEVMKVDGLFYEQ